MKLIINSKNWTGEFYLKLYKSNRKNVIIYFKSWTGEVAQVVKVRVFWSADSSPTDSETWQFSSKIMNLDYRWVHIVRCNINKYVFGNPSFLSSQNTKITLSCQRGWFFFFLRKLLFRCGKEWSGLSPRPLFTASAGPIQIMSGSILLRVL